MPIFGRRQLQQMLDELRPWLVSGKAKDLRERLDSPRPDQALPAEYELGLTWAVSKRGSLEIDKAMGSRTPDIFSADLLPSGPLVADVAALDDVSLSGTEIMERIRNIINSTCNEIRRRTSDHLHYTFRETSGYNRTSRGESKYFRRRLASRKFQMDATFRDALVVWLSEGKHSKPLDWRSEHVEVLIEWRDFVHPSTSIFCTMPSVAYDQRENPLYRVLKEKSKQLDDAPAGVRRAIFLGDAGCRLLNNVEPISSGLNAISGKTIIQAFLADYTRMDLVVVFSVQRPNWSAINRHDNCRVWRSYIFSQQGILSDNDLERLNELAATLPPPYLTGYEAYSWHEQKLFGARATGKYLGTTISGGKGTMTLRLSARAVQELIAGRLSPESFGHQMFGKENFVAMQLAAGRTIANVQFEPKGTDHDDDYLIG